MGAKLSASSPLAREIAAQAGVELPKKPHKYRAQKTVVDGITFPSKHEANRYGELLVLLKANYIAELELQKKFPIFINGHFVCSYIADFAYLDIRDGKWIVEDAKGVKTPEYRLKKRLMEVVMGIKIVEV